MTLGSQLRLQQTLGVLLWQALVHLSQTLLRLHPVLYLWVRLATLFVEARRLHTNHSMLLLMQEQLDCINHHLTSLV